MNVGELYVVTAPEHVSANASRVLLFSGHMIDAPGRVRPRFPPSLEPAAQNAIRSVVDRLDPLSSDVAVCSAACGGDILFSEAVLDRGMALRVYLPFDEPTFLEKSVNFANDRWPERYRTVVSQAELFTAPEVLGPLPEGRDPYERTNEWMLGEARRLGGPNVSFVCLWNGEGSDGPGGTQHMMETVSRAGGEVHWIDIRRL